MNGANDDPPLPPLFILDDQGTPILQESVSEWCRWFAKLEKRRIAATSLGNGAYISTIFLGLDLQGDGKLFQSVHFQGGSVMDEQGYDSREDALIGHDDLVERARRPAPIAKEGNA